MKRFLTGALGVVLLAGALCAGGLPARAAGTASPAAMAGEAQYSQPDEKDLDPSITMTVRYDYDDTIRVEHPIPAFITVENKGPALEAVVRLQLDTDPPAAYDLPVSLGQGETAELTLPFYAQGNVQNIEVKLLRGGRTVAVAKANRALSTSRDKLVGILSTNPDGMAAYHTYLTALKGEGAGAGAATVAVVDLTADAFPRQAYMLDRFALVVLNHFDLSLLDDVQQQALAGWVRGGGRLLVDADTAGAQALRSLRDIVALEAVGGFAAANAAEQLGALGGYVYPWEEELKGLGKVAPAGAVMAGSAAAPLITAHQAGAGKVFVTSFALDDPFFQQTRAAEVFGEVAGLSAWGAGDSGGDGIIAANSGGVSALLSAATSIEWLDAPALGWIVAVLLIFIALAAPLAYLVLAKLDKRDWIWVTTPALAVVFCALVMVFGLGGRGSQTVSATVSVVDMRAGHGAVQAYTLAGIGAAREGRYMARFEEDALPLPAVTGGYMPYSSGGPAQGAAPALTFGMGGYPAAEFANIRQWSMDSLLLRRDIPMAGALEAEVKYEADGSVTYRVANNTGADLEEVTLLSHLGHGSVLLLAAGEERTGTLAPYTAGGTTTVNGAYLVRGTGYYDLLQAYRQEVGQNFKDDEAQREAYLRYQLVSALVGSASFGGTSSAQYHLPDSALVWGFSRELGALSPQVNGKAPRSELNRTMVLATARVSYDAQSRLALPIALVDGTVSDMDGVQDGYTELGDTSAMFMGGEVTFAFPLGGKAQGYSLESLLVYCDYEYGSYEAALYNAKADRWDPYVVGGEVSGAAVSDYFNEEGTLQLKIISDAAAYEDYVMFEMPVLSVAGREEADA